MDLKTTQLYTMYQVNIHTGKQTQIYGHATHNVMDVYWQAYTDANHYVVIREYVKACEYCDGLGNEHTVRNCRGQER